MRFSCRQCRALLPGYIQRELSPKQRTLVRAHLTSCAECYVVYMTQQQLERELSFSVPRMGGAPPPGENACRRHGGGDAPCREAESTHSTKGETLSGTLQSELAALMLMIALLLPWSIRNHSFSLPTPPQPEKVTPQGTAVVALPTL